MNDRNLNLKDKTILSDRLPQEQLSLVSSEALLRYNQTEYPVNEGNDNVRKEIMNDISVKRNITIVTGYAGLPTLIELISKAKTVENFSIVFGNEPYIDNKNRTVFAAKKIEKEAEEYWLSKGISPSKCAGVIRAISLIEGGILSAKFSSKRNLHAKMMRTEDYVIFGSSNYSEGGLRKNREFNKVAVIGSEDYKVVSNFIDGCSLESEDYSERFKQILIQMLHPTTWKEALGKACSSLLEGDWVDSEIAGLAGQWNKLWPHQKQAVAQALSLAEIHGGAIIADPTGSGKTNSLAMAMRVNYNRLISKNIGTMDSTVPVLVCPPSVENNWHRALGDKVGLSCQVISMGILSQQKKQSSKNRVEHIARTPLIGVDEAHNYLNKNSNRTKKLKEHNADVTLLATATPINTGFSDLIRELEILGIGLYDPDLKKELWRLENDINSKNQDVRLGARKRARELIQPYMVRRTRTEIKDIAIQHQEKYLDEEGRNCNFPEYDARSYSVDCEKDNEILMRIISEVKQITGLSRINKVRRTQKEEENGVTEEACLRRTLSGSKGLAQSQIWSFLDSSKIALIEHIQGTVFAEEKFGIRTNKSQPSTGVLNILEKKKRPDFHLSEKVTHSVDFPRWLVDEDKFQEKLELEKATYKKIVELLGMLSSTREKRKIALIKEKIDEGKKILAFDKSIITLCYFEKELSILLGKEFVSKYDGTSSKDKKKKVAKAEAEFGKFSNEIARVGLMSDSMSEGINLQGASVLINLDWATTIRLNEQRVGRIDRMDTRHNSIEVYWPEEDLVLEQKSSNAIERNKLVEDVIGSNLELPPDLDTEFRKVAEGVDEYAPTNHQDVVKELFVERHSLEDAFKPVRDLIGVGGIVDIDTYEKMKEIDAKILSKVSLIESDEKWCFACISTRKNGPPIWVLIDGKEMRSEQRGIDTDFRKISDFLRERLPNSEDAEHDEETDEIISDYLQHLQAYESLTFSNRKTKIVESARDILKDWKPNSNAAESVESILLNNISSANVARVDLNGFIQKWGSLMREYQRRLDELPKPKRRNQKLSDYMKNNPPPEGYLEARFRGLSTIDPVDERVIALIIGLGQKEYTA